MIYANFEIDYSKQAWTVPNLRRVDFNNIVTKHGCVKYLYIADTDEVENVV